MLLNFVYGVIGRPDPFVVSTRDSLVTTRYDELLKLCDLVDVVQSGCPWKGLLIALGEMLLLVSRVQLEVHIVEA